MKKNEPVSAVHADLDDLLDQRISEADFRLQDNTAPDDLTPVMQIYVDDLLDMGFIFSHTFEISPCIGKTEDKPARMLVYLNVDHSTYALLTDLYHTKSWVYFTHYYTRARRIVTTCQPGSLQLESVPELLDVNECFLQNTGSSTLVAQWKKHLQLIASRLPDQLPLLMDSNQHMEAERAAYRQYTDRLVESAVLRASDTQMLGFTRTGARSYQAAITSRSAKRPQPKVEAWIGKRGKLPLRKHFSYRNAALAASAAVSAMLIINLTTQQDSTQPDPGTMADHSNVADNNTAAALPEPADKPTEPSETSSLALAPTTIDITPDNTPEQYSDIKSTADIAPDQNRDLNDNIATDEVKPEQFIIASEEDEMWRIAVENAEFYLMSNDGDPAPWIRTARKMAAGFSSDDSRLARTYFLAALMERDSRIAEQQYNRALSIQTKTLGLYHTETAQTLEALAWIAEGARDALEDAITHQRLALNIYRSILGEEAEDTRAARWKLQYFEDRLAGRRPKSDGNRRLLPALAKFTR